jgi:hypothetical protein
VARRRSTAAGPRSAAQALLGVVAIGVGLYAERAFARTGASAMDIVRDVAVGWAFVGAGLVAWRRGPRSRIGPLMVAEGLTWFIGNLQGTDVPRLVGAGVWLESLNDAILAHLVLSLPAGRLDTLPARLLTGAAYFVAVVVGLVRGLTFDPAVDGWATYLSCPHCGPNGLLVDPNPALFAAVDLCYRALGAAIAITCAGVVVRRWIVSTGADRRALLPPWAAIVVAAVVFTWNALHAQAPGQFPSPGAEPMLWLIDLSELAVPIAFLVGGMR